MSEMVLDLPWPPTSNTYYRHVSLKGRMATLISKRGRQYRKDIQRIIVAYGLTEPLSGRLKVEMELSPPDRRRRDIDNYCKGLFDALTETGKVWIDDEQIDHLTIIKLPKCEGGKALIKISEINSED